MPTWRVLDKPVICCHCGEPFGAAEEILQVNDSEARHTWQCPVWAPSGPVSDGSLRCPHLHRDMPCQKRIPAGWHQNEGHPGGHWFEPDDLAQARSAGLLHTDARAMLALEPYDEHLAADCPNPTPCPGAN